MTDQINEISENNITPNDTPETTENTTPEEVSFLDQITDEDLKKSKSLANFKDLNGLAKSYINLEKKLGAPKEPERYEEKDYTYQLPENYKVNEDLINPIREKAIELGVKPEAFKQLVETFTSKEHEILQQSEESVEAEIKALQDGLKKEWGESYDNNLKIAEDTFKRFATEEDQDRFTKLSPEGQLAVAKIMHNVSTKIGEGVQGKIGNAQTTLTREEALAKISEIRSNRELDLNTKNRQLASLYPIAYAGETGETLGVVTGYSNKLL